MLKKKVDVIKIRIKCDYLGTAVACHMGTVGNLIFEHEWDQVRI